MILFYFKMEERVGEVENKHQIELTINAFLKRMEFVGL
jgi:hypothetical protein